MKDFDVLVIGAGPAGTIAAARAAELGARTALITRDAFGGMAANDGPVPVRTLAYAAHIYSRARQLEEYGISIGTPRLDYARLLERVRGVVAQARSHSALRDQVERAGVALYERTGTARFVDAHTVETPGAGRFRAAKLVICAGGTARKLSVRGAEHLAFVSDAWTLTEVPKSLIVIGAGMTGAQVASIFHSFGTQVQ
ncbi:MAG TPA: FAD-dependent oxidoreductase, partial [Polyangiales bacterium]|nr:FAD-dependent oxidoreductase [Polyangiales bacterium]